MITDSNLKLVNAEAKHLPYLVRWLNTMPSTRIRHSKSFTSTQEQEARLAKLSKQSQLFIAYSGNEPHGFVEMEHIDNPSRITKVRTFVEQIGEQKVLRCAIKHCFEDLGRNKVVVEAIAGDADLIKVYEDAGFKSEVRRRQHYYTDGRYHHVVEMAILAKEFANV